MTAASTETVRYPHLTDQQVARVEALQAARETLAHRTGASLVSGATVSSVDALDLVSVARYVETGEDPWADSPQPADPQAITINTRGMGPDEIAKLMRKAARRESGGQDA